MELDDLKRSWNEQPNQTIKNTNIMELIQHKSYGPIAALKRAFKKQMRIMILIPVIIFFVNMENGNSVLKSVMFWSYVAFCLGVVVFSYFNYRVAASMEGMEGNVKANLEQQTRLLETRLRWNIIGLRIALLFFILLTEVLPYIQHYSMLDKWHSLSPYIRFGTYALLLFLQYVASRRISERKFGGHIKHLKELVKEMRD